MQGIRFRIPRVIGASLLVGALGCQSGDSKDSNGADDGNPADVGDLKGSVGSALLRAEDCPDLLAKIQQDAIMKAKLAAFQMKLQIMLHPGKDVGGSNGGGVSVDDGSFGTGGSPLPPNAGGDPSTGPSEGGGESGGNAGGGMTDSDGGGTRGPTAASGTNRQVADVDEADFVKLVKGGERMFLLHGSKLVALKSWPAAQTALDGQALLIEGSPSEMFVTEDGKRAVIFSSVYDYSNGIRGGASPADGPYCGRGYCGGGQSFAKVTVADLSGGVPKTVRELYYEGSYLSSRRYTADGTDVVRTVFQGYSRYAGLFSPDVEVFDAWGRAYPQEVLDSQLDEWVARTSASIEATVLEDWLPLVREHKGDKFVTIEPTCNAYYVPKAGLTDYGLTHVLSMDINDTSGKLGGVTIMGAATTVYSNADHLVLAQPDYRWGRGFDANRPGMDFGLVSEQETALHMFAINGADTEYKASGWVPGQVPWNNSQFAIDEKAGAIRIATTGWVRTNPKAEQEDPAFWESHPENHVFTTRPEAGVLKIAGATKNLGHPGETIFAARFVGDRGYVVTAIQQRDPLVVVDVKNPEQLSVLGEVEIAGFSQYVHPIDDNHLVTIGSNDSGSGIKLQMFDVTDPMNIPQPKVLDFGDGSSSEATYNHKAFTYFKEQNLLAVPLYNYGWNGNGKGNQYGSFLKVIKVSTQTGFKLLGAVDHARMYAEQNCGYCDETACYNYSCGYQPEVRRGHFVADDSDTFVYSISYGGVLVNNLDDLATPIASVELPAPMWSEGSWYEGTGGGNGSTPGGQPGGGNVGSDSTGGTKPPVAQDAGPATGGDADAGVAMQ